MEPLQIQCSHCQKKYLVAANSLSLGEARFQCTSCESLFALNWTPETKAAVEGSVDPQGVKQISTYLIEKHRKPKTCHKCQQVCFEEDAECPKCGVVFKKIEAPKVIRINSKVPELTRMWENVRKNYHDDNAHIDFIKACSAHDQLTYASQHYKSILIVNPAETTAQRMQKVILELIESKKELKNSQKHEAVEKPKRRLFKTTLIVCALCFAVGAFSPEFRPLIALSSSVLFFMMAYKFWISDTP